MTLAYIYSLIGPAGVALVLVAAVALYLALKTLIHMVMVRRDFNRSFLGAEKKGGKHLGKVCCESCNPLITIIRDIVTTHAGHSEDIRAEVAYLFHRNFEPVLKRLCYIRLISVVSPLLGLLGTILGMVSVFQTIADYSVPDAAMLASGIWEALITTIMGLSVAIPSLMVYYFLSLRLKGFHIEAVEYSYRAIELCAGVKLTKKGDALRNAANADSARQDSGIVNTGKAEASHV